MLGKYALLGAVGGVDTIRTPAGDEMPIVELSGLFYSQIAPLDYFPQVPRPESGAVEVAIIDAQTLEINGRRIALGRAYSGEVHTL